MPDGCVRQVRVSGLHIGADLRRMGEMMANAINEAIGEHPFFAMLARDPAAPHALRAYADKAAELGYDPTMITDVRKLADDYEKYRVSAGNGDPDAPRHRKDDPIVLAWARSIKSKGA